MHIYAYRLKDVDIVKLRIVELFPEHVSRFYGSPGTVSSVIWYITFDTSYSRFVAVWAVFIMRISAKWLDTRRIGWVGTHSILLS